MEPDQIVALVVIVLAVLGVGSLIGLLIYWIRHRPTDCCKKSTKYRELQKSTQGPLGHRDDSNNQRFQYHDELPRSSQESYSNARNQSASYANTSYANRSTLPPYGHR